MAENSKILGIIDYVYIGEVKEKGVCMVMQVKTFLHGDYVFNLSLAEMEKLITANHISDISLLQDAPVILAGDISSGKFNFSQVCKTRRIG